MTFDCAICNFSGKDNKDLRRHKETKKHLDRAVTAYDDDDELLDIRKMEEQEARNYIHLRKEFEEADAGVVAHRNALAEFGRLLKKREQFATKTPIQIQKDKQAIMDEYPENENEDESLVDERHARLRMAEYEGSPYELQKIQDKIDSFMGRQEANRKYFSQERILRAESAAKASILAKLKRRDAKQGQVLQQSQEEEAKAELNKKILEAEMAKLQFKYGKKS